ncbi:MAG: 7-carboxy-7-deazaguanine synthase QueE, partial [Bacteroidales bacterium]|nr:7-carboxy-7-deazaguanine synthase QueE [Bacteroidales bacterium]
MIINEIFYSLQGEGYYSGTPAVFVRLSGCNLQCPFCDTQHGAGTEMSEEEIVDAVKCYPARHVVITGGEPSLQLTESLVDILHAAGKYMAVETNGTRPLPANVDWITLSPKSAFVDGAEVVLTR